MKQLLQGKVGTAILVVVAVAAVLVAVWHVADLDKVFTVSGAIRDIAASRNVAQSRAALEQVNDRAYVLERLESAVMEDDGSVRGKMQLLNTLSVFNQPRALYRALDAPSVPAQRAACALMFGSPEYRDRCAEIAIAWLRDEGADERSQAALICGQLDLAEADAVFLEIVGKEPQTQDELRLFQQALNALRNAEAPGLAERLLSFVENKETPEELRGVALEALERMKGAPRERVLEAALALLADPKEPKILRSKASLGLREFPEERAWDALEKVLLSQEEQDWILQRNCLYALGQKAPIERVKRLLLDRRLYQHPYYGIRVDVATALAALNVREGITIDIMCDYLVDEDKDDRDHIVRQDAWLTLWVLSGTPYGIAEQDLFRYPPRPFVDPEQARDFLFRRSSLRPGITREMAEAVEKLVPDLTKMQQIRHTFGQTLKPKIIDRWEAEAQAAAGTKKDEEKEQAIDPQGPVAPQGPQKPGEDEGGK